MFFRFKKDRAVVFRWLVVVFAIGLMVGCFARVNENRYYLLDYVPTPPDARIAKGPYEFSVRIKDFDVAEAYRRNNIVYRQSPHELRFYSYELWAVKPEYLVTDMFYRHLESARLFQNVTRTLDMVEPDFVLSGQVSALEEYDNKDEWYAHLAMSMSLQNTRTREVVWSKAWDYRKKVRQLEPVFVVRELSSLLEVVGDEAVASLDSVLAVQNQQPIHAIHNSGAGVEPPPPSIHLPPPESMPPPEEVEP